MTSIHQAQKIRSNQNYIGVWFHDPYTPSSDIIEAMLKRLNSTFDYVQEFDDEGSFTTYLRKDKLIASVIIIISSHLKGIYLQDFVMRQVEEEPNKFREPYRLFMKKIQYTQPQMLLEIDDLFLRIHNDIQDDPQSLSVTTPENTPTISVDNSILYEFIPPLAVGNPLLKQISIRHLSNESRRFIQFQALMEILFRIEHDRIRAKEDMLSDCRTYYGKDILELEKIKEFDNRYSTENVLEFYTNDGFCFRMVNMAFRSEDIERIHIYRLFISDLHKELKRLYSEQQKHNEKIIVYRGKKLRNVTVQQLKDNIDERISMNGFLSTSRAKNVAKLFSGDDVARDKHESVIFEIHIENIENYTGKPFADISMSNNEEVDEQEVLFSAGTIWKIENVERKDHIWHVTLINCSEDLDHKLHEHLNELTDGYSVLSIGKILEELEEYDKAENFYRRMLVDESNVLGKEKGILFYRIGMLRLKKKDNHGALDCLEKAIPYFISHEETTSKIFTINPSLPSRFNIYSKIGWIYHRNKNRKEAREAWEKALLEQEAPENLAKIHDYLGELAKECGNYDQAAEHYHRAMALIPPSSTKEQYYTELKRKHDQAIEVIDQFDQRQKQKRQRTTTDAESNR